MTMQEILAKVAAGEITDVEAGKMLSAMTPPKAASAGGGWKAVTHVSRNKSGGVFVRHPLFLEVSEAKGKEYVAGINLPPNVARILFGNPAVYAELAKLVMALPAGKSEDQPAMAAS